MKASDTIVPGVLVTVEANLGCREQLNFEKDDDYSWLRGFMHDIEGDVGILVSRYDRDKTTVIYLVFPNCMGWMWYDSAEIYVEQ